MRRREVKLKTKWHNDDRFWQATPRFNYRSFFLFLHVFYTRYAYSISKLRILETWSKLVVLRPISCILASKWKNSAFGVVFVRELENSTGKNEFFHFFLVQPIHVLLLFCERLYKGGILAWSLQGFVFI